MFNKAQVGRDIPRSKGIEIEDIYKPKERCQHLNKNNNRAGKYKLFYSEYKNIYIK